MSPNSSTSSSSYLRLAAAVAVLLFTAMAGACFYLKWLSDDTEAGALVHFQERRLAVVRDVDTVFLGDSSLGNAIDTSTFDRLTGTHSVSLALSGNFGYAGSYNMLRRAMKKHPVRNVILVHTADILMRPPSYVGHVRSAPDFDLSGFDFQTRWALIKAFGGEFLDLHGLHVQHTPTFTRDYVRQDEGRPWDFDPLGEVTQKHPVFLARIVAACREFQLNCIYVYGPLARPIIDGSHEAIEDSSEVIRSMGMTLLTAEPPPIAYEDRGDSEDHVAPEARDQYTAIYAAILGPHLRLGDEAEAQNTSQRQMNAP